jgi:serine/threonine protein kinase
MLENVGDFVGPHSDTSSDTSDRGSGRRLRKYNLPTLPLSPGSRIGPYEILAPLGAGGMGEVYRARDERLKRDVAIKVLPSHLSSSAEVRQRFEGVAKTIS